jgi:hypothetical protein
MTSSGRWPIRVTDIGRQNIAEKHRRHGPFSADKGVFRDDLSVEDLAAAAEHAPPIRQPVTGRWLRVVAVGTEEPVGWDRDDDPRWEYTVVTEGDSADGPHDLFNAFPGRPSE